MTPRKRLMTPLGVMTRSLGTTALEEGGDKTVGVKVFLVGGCREVVLMIKDEVASVYSIGGGGQDWLWMFGVRIRCGRRVRFKVEEVEVELSGFKKSY